MRSVAALSFHSSIQSLQGALRLRGLFDHAWHLQTADGSILTVTTASFNGPLTIRTTAVRLDAANLAPGMTGHLDGGVLRLGPFTVDLRHAQPWAPSIPSFQPDPAGLRTRLEGLTRRQREARRGGIPIEGGAGPFVAAARPALRHLCRGLALPQDRLLIQQGVEGLLGLGPGLTPSGDDLLCGLLLGLRTLHLEPALRALDEAVQARAPERTTALSVTLLRWAGCGVALEPLLDVLWDLGGRQGTALNAVLRTGHSSGSDMLTGVILAGQIWEEIHGAALERAAQHVR